MIKEIEERYPQTTVEFKSIQADLYRLFCKKQADYGPGNKAGGTMIRNKRDVNWALICMSTRMNDNIQRLMNLLRTKQKPNNESIDDTLRDLGNYAIMSLILINNKWGK